MARRRKGYDLAIIEAMVPLVGISLLYIYLKDANLERALFKLTPLLLVGVGVTIILGFTWFVISSGTKLSRGNTFAASPQCEPASVLPRVAPARLRIPERVVKPALSIEEKLEQIDWFQFEQLIAMLYMSRGCVVERRGGANPDGGIDLVVQTGGERVGVQCKFWKTQEVGVRQVRELMGALQDQGIPKGRIASMKGFTEPARELAARNGIELVGKSAVLAMLHDARFTPYIRELNAIMDCDEKRCPRCERQMVKRTSSKDGNRFWGCSHFPRCRYTMQLL